MVYACAKLPADPLRSALGPAPVQDAIAAHRAQELLLKRGVECTAQETFLFCGSLAADDLRARAGLEQRGA